MAGVRDVFLSYARSERERVLPIRDILEDAGLTVFLDLDGIDGGDQYPEVIDAAVKQARCVIGAWSEKALSRAWVINECRIGFRRGRLITLALEPFSQDLIPTEFGAPHLIDASESAPQRGRPDMLRSLSKKLERPDLLTLSEAMESGALKSDQVLRLRVLSRSWEHLKMGLEIGRVERFLEQARATPLELEVEAKLAELHQYFGKEVNKARQQLRSLDKFAPNEAARIVDDFWRVGGRFHRGFCRELEENAAEHGSVTSMFKVAVMYSHGDGGPRQLDKALRWASLAADEGHSDAIAMRAALREMVAREGGVT